MMSPAQKLLDKISAQMKAGQFAAAAKTASTAAKKFPKESGFSNAAGSAFAQAGNFAQAVTFFNKALALAPGNAATQDNLLRALVQAGRAEKAIELIAKLLPKRTSPLPLLMLKAHAEMAIGDHAAILATTSKALDLKPNQVEALSLRGVTHDRLGNNDAAAADHQRAAELDPTNPTHLVNLAEPLTRLHHTDRAFQVLEQALALAPNDLRARRFYAVQLAQAGRGPEANTQYLKILEMAPQDGPSFRALVSAQNPEENAALLPALQSAMANAPRKSDTQIDLNLAMGNLLYQKKDFEGAATALAAGNALAAKARPYIRKAAEAEFTALTRPDAAAMSGDPDTEHPRPIFVIGQPRSGTTLVEMILSAHPLMASCGEMESAGRVLDPAAQMASVPLPQLTQAFRNDLPDAVQKTMAFVDKMPSNYRYVGYLAAAFPEARFIHVTRDPRDVALSMWRNYFPNSWMNFTFDLTAMAHQANLYARYMTHWQAQVPDRILALDYADIVQNVEQTSRQMAAFCDLNWVQEMAQPDQNSAMVRTASVTQVREGVHARSVGGWQLMQTALQPFIDGLDRDLWPDLADKIITYAPTNVPARA